ncbi:hypothetical protein [Marinobacterium zhoushanense]|uniref:hypothetical protein n=1 Tax=Marinobacterium zhoushanense TaxID=1679163 RepID=UPI00166BA4FE|nr:hypothetical protein [Marinobacterium zhoushanense]
MEDDDIDRWSTDLDPPGHRRTASRPLNIRTAAHRKVRAIFYLLDIPTKTELWQYPRKIINWPMMISANGAAIIGGSDTGELFF